MRTAYSDVELQAMMTDVESDLVERKETFDGDAPRTVREAICAFAKRSAGRRRPGVVFVGVRDDGTPTGLEINDALLLKLAHCKTDGNILPPPSMTVGRHVLGGKDVAVVTVAPADSRRCASAVESGRGSDPAGRWPARRTNGYSTRNGATGTRPSTRGPCAAPRSPISTCRGSNISICRARSTPKDWPATTVR